VVLGSTVVEETTTSCNGPILVIGAPLAALPSWICPVLLLKAAATPSNSPSKSDALIILPSAILLAESTLV